MKRTTITRQFQAAFAEVRIHCINGVPRRFEFIAPGIHDKGTLTIKNSKLVDYDGVLDLGALIPAALTQMGIDTSFVNPFAPVAEESPLLVR